MFISFADEFTADGVHSFYIGEKNNTNVVAQFNDDFTVLTVFKNGEKGIAKMKDWSSPYEQSYTYNPAYEHADTLKRVVVCDGVVSVGAYFCYECDKLESLEIADTVVSIGDHAFRKTGIKSLTLPVNLLTVGERAFSGCHELKGNITIPDKVKSIGDYAFYNCYSADGDLTLGASLKTIGVSAFSKCYKLKGSLVFPSGLYSIGAYCFESCESLSGALTLNEGLNHIGDGAFNHCKGFTNETLLIPSTLETIGGDTAYEVDVYSATPVNPPSGYFNHSSHVFYDFANNTFEEFTVDGNNANFVSVDGVLYTADMKRLIAYPTAKKGSEFVIPEGVETIDEMAFGRMTYSSNSDKLLTVVLPDSYVTKGTDNYDNALNREAMCSLSSALYLFSTVENISVKDTNQNYISVDGCLYSKDGKTLICVPSGKKGNVIVPDGVNTVAYGAFAGCNGVDYFVLPSSVSDISDIAFDYCNSPETVVFDGSYAMNYCTAQGIDYHLFGDINSDGSVDINDYNFVKSDLQGNALNLNALQLLTGDCNLDSSIDAFDLFYIDEMINLSA